MLQRTLDKFENFNVVSLYTEKGYSLNEIESIVGSDKRCIRNYLLSKGVEVKGIKSPEIIPSQVLIEGKSGRRFNYKFFDKIDTEEKAYWLGFIYADGCITNETFSISLQATDVGHLHKFNRSVECKDNNVKYHPKITNEKTYDGYRWAIKNKHFNQRLNECGCVERKSLILKFPDVNLFNDESLIRHFLRGYFDGDGGITFTVLTKSINILGTKEFLTEYNNRLPIKFTTIKPCKNVFYVSTSSKKAYKILKYLYDGATIYLDRKYNKYLEFCRLYGKPYRELVDKNGESCDGNTVLTSEIAEGLEVV